MTAERLVVIGGGPAALEAARSYREAGADGEVVLVSGDEYLPYNRPPLSKDFLRGESQEDALPLEDGDFYRHHAIEVRLRTRAQALDTVGRVVTLSDGRTLGYGYCILATGASPKPLPVRGAEGSGCPLPALPAAGEGAAGRRRRGRFGGGGRIGLHRL